jgi:diacylglycerol kinase (ATP)
MAGGGVGRSELIAAAAGALARLGYEVETIKTVGVGSAGRQAAEAAARGVGVVFACGGDGTVNEVLQGVVGSGAALGVLPMGSANALARDLGLSMDVVEAARQYAGFSARRVPVGRLELENGVRYFAVMAGAGPTGALVYRMMAEEKRRLGRFSYYVRALGLFLGRRFPGFEVEVVESGSGDRLRMMAVSAMAVRVADLGGLFRRLAHGTGAAGAGLGEIELRLILVRRPAWLSLPLWFCSSWVGVGRWNPWLRVMAVDEFSCDTGLGGAVQVQVDGEWIGRTPMRVSLVRDGLWLMMAKAD